MDGPTRRWTRCRQANDRQTPPPRVPLRTGVRVTLTPLPPKPETVPLTRIADTGGAKILTIDIERSQGWASLQHRGLTISGPFWDLNDWKHIIGYRIPAKYVTKWPQNICAAWRWYGEKRVGFAAIWEDGGADAMHHKLWDLYNDANIIVGHNVKRFDTKKLTTVWLEMGLPRPLPYQFVDTLTVARNQFGFESNTLDALCVRLGIPGKVDAYSVDLANQALAGNKAAQRRLRRYNAGDIEASEFLFDRLRGWIPQHPFMGRSADNSCNQCGSTDLTLQPTRYRAVVIDYAMYRCNNCQGIVRGGWHSRAATTRGVA